MNCEIIEKYTNTLPSASTRAVTLRELKLVNSHEPLSYWNRDVAIKYLRKIQPQLQPSTVRLRMNRIKGFFDFLIDENLYQGPNPINRKIIPRGRDIKDPQVLTQQEVKKFLSKIPRNTFMGQRDRCCTAMQLIHGFRLGTVLAMDWEHLEKRGVDWYIYTKGKGNVMGSRRLRADVFQQLNKLHKMTFGVELK